MTAGVGATFGGHRRAATGMGDATLWQEVEESERSNWGKWNFLPALLPSFLELLKVDEPLFVNQFQSFFRQKAFVNISGFYLNQCFVFGINRVEVHWRVVAIVKPNDNTIKSANFRHGEF